MSRTAKNAAPILAEPEAVAAGIREFDFSEADFRSLAQLAHEYAGIALADNKRNLVYTRVSRRLRALRLNAFRDYRKYLAEHRDEVENFINAISTNLTKFFRESHHFDHFRNQVVLPFARAASQRQGSRFRVWSAGCSTGEEPYTIAAVICEGMQNLSLHDVRVLASDIDTDVLGKAARGEYPAQALDDIPKLYRDYFCPGSNGKTAGIHVAEPIRSIIRFRRLNLIEPWPFKGQFDAIFCRNVMIYFDAPTKSDLIDRFINAIRPGGFLYIGHSESLLGSHPELQLVGRTVYRRKG